MRNLVKKFRSTPEMFQHMMILLFAWFALTVLVGCESKDAAAALSAEPPVESPIAPVPTSHTYQVRMYSPGNNVWTYFAYNAETPTNSNANAMRLWVGGETITIQGTELDLVVVNYVDPQNLGVPANPLTVEVRKDGVIIQSVILTNNLEDVEFQGL